MTEPILPSKNYFLAYVAMMGLLLLNVLLAFLNMGWVNMFIGLVIATMQAAILALVMMHGLFEKILVHGERLRHHRI